jgi:hypothetical protein
MKTAALFVAASMAGAVAAQSLTDYFPKCSIDCLEDATKEATSCSVTDAVCFCVQSNYEAIYNSGLACVLKDCGNDVAVGKVPLLEQIRIRQEFSINKTDMPVPIM